MKYNWGMITVFISGILFWSSVWFNGLFISVMWLIILSAILGIGMKLYEDRYFN